MFQKVSQIKTANSHFKKVFLAAVLSLTFVVGTFYSFTTTTNAAIPKYINFQGKLTAVSGGTNVANGTYAFEFKLYDALTSGSLLWTETFDQPSGSCGKLTVTNGVFNAKLGSCASLASVDFTGGSVFLSVNFAPTGTSYDGEMSPRKQLVSSAFAFVANGVSGDGAVNTANSSATALTVAKAGTDYALQVDTSAGSAVTGLKVTSAAAAGGLALTTLSTATDESLSLNAKGAGQLSIGSTSTGNINIGSSGTGDILLGGGSASTGCTVTNSTGAFACSAGGTFTTLGLSGAITGATGITSSGTIQFSALTSNGPLYTSAGNGTLTTTAPTSGAIGYWSRTGTVLSQTTANDTISLTGNAGDIITVASSATGSANKALNVSQTGGTTGTDYAGYFSNTGSATTNIAGYFTASGATNNYAAIFDAGNVGIGTTTPTNLSGTYFGTNQVNPLWVSANDGSKVTSLVVQGNLGEAIQFVDQTGAAEADFGVYTTDLYFVNRQASGGIRFVNATSTAMYIDPNSNVGIGTGVTSLPSLLSVGTSSVFQVNSSGAIAAATGILSSGTIRFSSLTSNGPLYTSAGNGTLTTTAPTSGAIGYWSRSSTTISPTTANDIILQATTNTTGADLGITNTGVYTGTGIFNLTANSATTGTLASITGNGLTTGSLLSLSSSSTAATTGQKGLNVALTGALTGAQTTYGGYFSNTRTGASAVNVGLYATASGATGANYAAIFDAGNVGIGTTTPTAKLQVSGDILLSNGANRTINVEGETGINGRSLTIASGNTTAGGIPGDLILRTGTGGSGTSGNVLIYAQGTDPGYVILQRNTGGIVNGGVGVQTNLPAGSFEINSSSGNNLRLTYNDSDGSATNYVDLLTTSSGNLQVRPSGFVTEIGGGATRTALRFLEPSGTGTDYVGIQANANVTTSYTWTLPAADASGCIQSNGSGTLSIASCGGAASLQSAYDGTNTITTTTGRNIAFTLGEVVTPTSFTIENQDTAATSVQRIFNSIASGTATNGLLIEQTGAGTMTNAIQIAETAGTITDGILITGTLGNILNSGSIDITGAGAITGATGIVSSGTIQFSSLTSNGPLYTSAGNGTLTTTAPTSGAIGYWSRTGTVLSQTTANDTISLTGNAGDIITVASSATGSDNKAINISQTGGTTGTDYAGYFSNTGSATTNIAGYFTASGATNNYAAIFDAGNVGIGDTTPAALFTVGSGDLFQVNSSGTVTTTSTINAMGSTPNALYGFNNTQSGSLTTGTIGYNTSLLKTGGTGTLLGVSADLTYRATATSSFMMGGSFTTNTSTTGGVTPVITTAGGVQGVVNNVSGATITTAYSGYFSTVNSGTGTMHRGIYIEGGQLGGTLGTYNAIDINNYAIGGTLSTLKGINMSGWSSGGTVTTSYGIYMDTSIDIGSTRYAMYSSSTSNSYMAGNLGLGDISPAALLTVGNGDLFQVNSSGAIAAATGIVSSGTIQFSSLTSNGPLYTSAGNGTLTTTAPTSGAIGYWSRTGTVLSQTTANDVVTLNTTNTTGADLGITNTGVYTGTGIFNLTANSATTGTLASITGNGLTTGSLLSLSSSSTAATTGQKGLNVALTGALTGAQTTYGGYFSNTRTGASAVNVGLYATASGATGANYAAIFDAGNVGIGTIIPSAKLTVDSNSNSSAVRLFGATEASEIADIYVQSGGRIVIDTTAGSSTSGFIDLKGEDDEYGLVLRDSSGVSTGWTNFYMNDVATDYLNVCLNCTNAGVTGLVVQDGGNVGVGTTGPDRNFDSLDASSPQVRLTTTDGTVFADLQNTATANLIVTGDTLTSSSAKEYGIQIAPTVNQTSSASYTGLDVSVTETAATTINGLNRLADFRVGGSSKFAIRNDGSLTLQDASGITTPFGGIGSFQNHLVRSEEFDNASWVKTSVTAPTANTQVAPDGSTSAESLATSGSGGDVCQWSGTAAASDTFTFSVWAKASSGTQNFDLRIDAGATSCATANNVTGTAVTHTATTSWQRFTVTQTFSSATGNVKARIFPGTTGSTGTIYAWGAQLDLASKASTYVLTTSGALTNSNKGQVLESNFATASGFTYGGRHVTTLTGAISASSSTIGQLIRVIDNASGTDDTATVRGLEVQSYSGTNINGINTAIAAFGYTFGVHAATTGQANEAAQPAAIFADLDNGSAPTSGNAIRAYSNDATSADLVSIYQETSAYSGNALEININGTFTGNFADFQTSGTTKFKVDKDGNAFATLNTGNSERLCWDGAGGTAEEIFDCTGTPGDLAENFGTTDASIEAMDIVVSDGHATDLVKKGEYTTKAFVEKSTRGYQSNIIGVISTNPNEVYANDIFTEAENPRPVALVGRVPVKVTLENGPIVPGDYITSSNTEAGKGMKATRSGMVVGQALSGYDGTGQAQVIVFVNTGFQSIGNSIVLDAPSVSSVNLQSGAEDLTSNNASTFVIQQQASKEDGSEAVSNILQLQTGDANRFMVSSTGATSILSNLSCEPETLLENSDCPSVLKVTQANTELMNIDARGTLTLAGTIFIKDDSFAGSVVTAEDGLAEITFSYNLGTGKPVVQLTAESQIPVFAQIVEFKQDDNGNYTGFVMRTFDLMASPVQAVVHYNVTGKQADYITLGDVVLSDMYNAGDGAGLIIDGGEVLGGSTDGSTGDPSVFDENYPPLNPDDITGVVPVEDPSPIQ